MDFETTAVAKLSVKVITVNSPSLVGRLISDVLIQESVFETEDLKHVPHLHSVGATTV